MRKRFRKVVKENQALIKIILGFIDVLASSLILMLAIQLTNRYTTHKVTYNTEVIITMGIMLISWIILLKVTNLARIPRASSYSIILYDFIRLSVIGGLILLTADWFIKIDDFPAITIVIFIITNSVILYTIRILTFKLFKTYRANGHNLRNILIIADNDKDELIEKIFQQKEWGFRILGIVTDSQQLKEKYYNKIKLYSSRINLKSIIQYDIIDELICFDCKYDEEKLHNLIDFCSELGVTFRLKSIKLLNATSKYKNRIQYFGKIPFYTVENNPNNNFTRIIKHVVEVAAAFLILFFLSPLLLLISIIIASTSRGPVIFKQARVGLRGRQFYIYKFRTMVQNAEALKAQLQTMNEADGPTFKIKKDPRITAIGRFLRKTSLDEIPQLFNIINGEMSMIGPRPPLPKEVEQYERWQLKRLSVKPGLTCTWQITPNRNDVKFEKWMQMDIQYIDNWTLSGDIELFFRTFKTVLFAKSY